MVVPAQRDDAVEEPRRVYPFPASLWSGTLLVETINMAMGDLQLRSPTEQGPL